MSVLVKTWAPAPPANEEAQGASTILSLLSQVKILSVMQIDSGHLGSAREERGPLKGGQKRGIGLQRETFFTQVSKLRFF